MSQYPNVNEGKSSGGKVLGGCGIGCLVILLVAVGIVVGGYFFLKGKAVEFVDSHLGDQPVEIVQAEADPQAVEEALTRFDSFRASMVAGENPGPLILSDNDLNAILNNHSDFEMLAGKAVAKIEDDQLSAQVSIPFDDLGVEVPFIGEALKGKYINGQAAFSLELENGRPSLFIEGLEVNGATLPLEVIQELKKENLLKDAQTNPKIMKAFEMLEEIKIENNQLRIVPKAAKAN